MPERNQEAKNLGAVFDTHVKAEFIDMDVAATMATMVAEPYLTHVPTMTGGNRPGRGGGLLPRTFCRPLARRC